MRRISASRATAAVAVVAAIVAVLAVMFPGLGFGQITSSHGGSPSDVLIQTGPIPDTPCGSAGAEGTDVMVQDLTLNTESHLLVYFSGEWDELEVREVGLLAFKLDGQVPFEWSFPGTIGSLGPSGTVMWVFEDVSAGHHDLRVAFRVESIPDERKQGPPAFAVLEECALTVIVTPVVE